MAKEKRPAIKIPDGHKRGFPPIAGKKPRILILGSMPGEESLRKREYYAHKRNLFWAIMGHILGFSPDKAYCERKAILRKNRIALWDVLMSCERKGSLDSSIVGATSLENDFLSFYLEFPAIKCVFFNGTKAETEYRKRVLPAVRCDRPGLIYKKLPSTSPAMAGLTKEEKLARWSVIMEKIG